MLLLQHLLHVLLFGYLGNLRCVAKFSNGITVITNPIEGIVAIPRTHFNA